MQCAATLDGNPLVFFAPENLHRAANRRVQTFSLTGIALVHLRNLPIERRLPRITEPRPHVGREFVIRNIPVDRPANISRHDGALDVIGQAAERRFMLTHMLHER